MGWSAAAMVAISAFSAREQSVASTKAKNAQSNAAMASEAQDLEARRMAASAKPMEEQATLVTGKSKGSLLGNLGLMVEPTSNQLSTLGGTTKMGLGFGSNS